MAPTKSTAGPTSQPPEQWTLTSLLQGERGVPEMADVERPLLAYTAGDRFVPLVIAECRQIGISSVEAS